MRAERKSLLGMGLLALFALCMLIGIRYGPAAVWRLHLDFQREPLPVLMYHKVIPDDLDDAAEPLNKMTVTPSKLREDFQYLLDHGYTTVLPRELLDPKTLPEKPVLITFDDGYARNYDLLYPLLQEYGIKATISIIVYTQDVWAEEFLNWYALREMSESGLIEVGSHTYNLHNADSDGLYLRGEANGIQRWRGEADAAFQSRVLADIQKSYDRIEEELGYAPTFFSYPFGSEEPDAQELIDRLFPVSALTRTGTADMARGLARLPRWTITMDIPLWKIIA